MFDLAGQVTFIYSDKLDNMCPKNCPERLRKIWVFGRKKAQLTTVLPFLGNFFNFLLVFGPFCLRKTFKEKYWSHNFFLESLCTGSFTMSPLLA